MIEGQRLHTEKQMEAEHHVKHGNALYVIFHLLPWALFGYVTYLAQPGSSVFSWHPPMMTLGFAVFMVEAICIFSRDLGLLPESSKGWKVTAHWFLQSLGLFSMAFGFVAVYYNKDLFSKPHFVTWHAWIGLATLAMTAFQVGMGLGTKHAYWYRYFVKPVRIKNSHLALGIITAVLSCASLILGSASTWFTRESNPILAYMFMGICVLIYWCVSLNTIATHKKRLMGKAGDD